MKIIRFLLFIALTVIANHSLQAETVNINEADAATIAHNLKGIGQVKATSIVNYRKEKGKFKKLNELILVKGIGEKIFEKVRKDISLKSGLTRTAVKQKILTSKIDETIEQAE